MVSEQHLAVPREMAARLAGLSYRQVDYWAATGLIEATVDNQVSPGRRVRLYGFVDLMALMVAAELRARGFSLQHIRKLVRYFKSRGVDEPLTELRWATSGKGKGKTIYIQFPDGSWEDDISPIQIVFHEILEFKPLRHRIQVAMQRDASTVGHVERRRGVLGGKPVLAGTRVPVDTVRRYLAAGRSVDDILRAFPVLTAADVEAVRTEIVA
ncbi:MAG: DUF433 domain-containing protein [Actinomycetota bacterium]|nr:DUF433 domain-containing protein [Actinomycetota bacterium]